MDQNEKTENSTGFNPETSTSSTITIKSVDDIHGCSDLTALKSNTDGRNREDCDDRVGNDERDIPETDDTTGLSVASPCTPDSEPNSYNGCANVSVNPVAGHSDYQETTEEPAVLERNTENRVNSVETNSSAETVCPQQSHSPVINKLSEDIQTVVPDTTGDVDKNRCCDALSVIVTSDDVSGKDNNDDGRTRIDGKSAEKSKQTSGRKLKRVTGGDSNAHLSAKHSSSSNRISNSLLKTEQPILKRETFDFSESFGESHVNKLMSFVDSLEKLNPPLNKACGMMSSSQLGVASQTRGFNLVTPVKSRHPGDDLFKPYTTSPPNLTNRNISSKYLPKSAGLVEQPLDLSLSRQRSPGSDFMTKQTGECPSFQKCSALSSSMERMSSKFGDKTMINKKVGNNVPELSSIVKHPWVPHVGSASVGGINWSLAASSLASLQAQMEAVILSYPLFKASIELCKNLIPPVNSENVCAEDSFKLKIKEEAQDNKDENISPSVRYKNKKEDYFEQRLYDCNPKEMDEKKSVYYPSSASNNNHSAHVSRKKSKLLVSTNRNQQVTTEWRSNHSSLKRKYTATHENLGNNSQLEECTTQNTKVGSLDSSQDFKDDKRLLTSLSCSCKRQFATLYQLTIHLEETGHHPSQAKTDSADDFAKLVRGQDLWLSAGHAQAEQTLRCMHCHASFLSLPELTVHMVKTKHYVDIVGREESDVSRQLISREVLQKIQQTLIGQEFDSTKTNTNQPHVCKQCQAEFEEDDDLSEHLFETGHQMLAEKLLPVPLTEQVPHDSRDYDNLMTDKGKESLLTCRRSCNTDNDFKTDGTVDSNQLTVLVKCDHMKAEYTPDNNKSPSVNDGYKSSVDQTSRNFLKSEFDSEIEPDNSSDKKCNDISDKHNILLTNISKTDQANVNAKRKRESGIRQSSIGISKRKPFSNKLQKSPDHTQSRHDMQCATSQQMSPVPAQTIVASRPWNENIVNPSNTNYRNGDVCTKGFLELISPSPDIGDSSSTLRAMESFVERSFSSSSNLVMPVTHFALSQAGRLNSHNATSYSNAIRSATSCASRHDVGFNWDVRKSAIMSHKVHLQNRKDATLTTDSSSDGCHSPPVKRDKKENLDTTGESGESSLLVIKTRRDNAKRKRNDCLSEFEACNSPLNSLISPSPDKIQPKKSHSNQSSHLINPILKLKKSEDLDSEKAPELTDVVKSSYRSSTLEYLQHFVDDRALKSSPPPLGSGKKSLQDVGSKLSIKT